MYTLTLTIEQINVIIAGLGKLPLENSLDAYTMVRMQVEQQMKAAQEQVAPPAEPAEPAQPEG